MTSNDRQKFLELNRSANDNDRCAVCMYMPCNRYALWPDSKPLQMQQIPLCDKCFDGILDLKQKK